MQNCGSSKNTNRHNLLTKIIFGAVFVLGIANLIATNIVATQGIRLNNLNTKTALLAKENEILTGRLNEIRSLAEIESRALSLGMVRTNQIVHISGENLYALAENR